MNCEIWSPGNSYQQLYWAPGQGIWSYDHSVNLKTRDVDLNSMVFVSKSTVLPLVSDSAA